MTCAIICNFLQLLQRKLHVTGKIVVDSVDFLHTFGLHFPVPALP